MSGLQAFLTASSAILIVGILGGLLRRGVHRLCYSFIAYLTAVLLCELLIFVFPSTFYHLAFWEAKETLYALMKLAIAIELGILAFEAFPGALHRARQLAVVGFAVLALTLASRPSLADPDSLVLEVQARLNNGAALLLAAVWGLVLWYRVPLHWLHRAILRGFVPFLLVFTVVLQILLSVGWDFREQASHAAGLFYVALLCYWIWVAWSSEPAPGGPPDLLARLQPWRARL